MLIDFLIKCWQFFFFNLKAKILNAQSRLGRTSVARKTNEQFA